MNIILYLVFIFYQIIQIISIPILPIFLLIRKFKKKSVFGNFKERLGFVPKTNTKNIIWIHAVSVGEILSIQNLIDEIKKNKPNSLVYLTTGTITGKNIAIKNKIKYDYISFLPYDFLFSIFIAFKRIKPNYLIIVEAEIWPNLLFITKLLKIPAFLINARISDRSKKKYLMLKSILKIIFNIFEQILTQSNYDKKMFEKLGVTPQKLKVLGNIKALNVQQKKHATTKYNFEKKYTTLLVSSIHPGELNIYLNLYQKLKMDEPNLKLILAPRHFHWKNKLINKIKKINESFFLSEETYECETFNVWDEKNNINTIFNTHNILLVCKLGELFNLYQFCDINFLGGTFVPIGGHNLLEPAVWAIPSIVGPHYQNTKTIALELQATNGIFLVKNQTDLYLKTKKLIFNNNERISMGKNSLDWLKEQSKTIHKNIQNLINLFTF